MARFKQRLSFYAPPSENLRAILDAAKVADTLLFVMSVEEPVDEHGHFCLKCLQSQGLPASFFVCRVSLKKKFK
jgi:pre-rRNA-processing protein TSR1